MIKKIQILLLFFTLITNNSMANHIVNRSFKAVIFDMDGTIIDTEKRWKEASLYILDTYALHLDEAQKNEIVHNATKMVLNEKRKHLHSNCSSKISMEKLIQEKANYVYRSYETRPINLIPFFHEFHGLVISHGLKTAIATNSYKKDVDAILKTTPLYNYFSEHIYTIDLVNNAYKPNPDIYLHAAKMLGVDPADCIVIEDTANGIKAAKAAGMYCIGINTGKNRALLAQADEIVDCFSEINLEQLLNL